MWEVNLPEAHDLRHWLGELPREPRQYNRPFTADCELLALDDELFLALTVDSVSEEIACGLYRDPFTQGWLAAACSLSDLAAVGAEPRGLLFSCLWSESTSAATKQQVAAGLKACLAKADVRLLGGDSGSAATTVLSSVGVGLIKGPQPITRLGLQAGDFLVASGPCGVGPALAYRLLLDRPEAEFPESQFRPVIPVGTRRAFARYAAAMIDTSDGTLAACHSLCELNAVGLELSWDENYLSPSARKFCHDHEIPLWALWLAEHGDYELLAAVRPASLAALRAVCPEAHVIAQVKATPGIWLDQGRGRRRVNTEHAALVGKTPASQRKIVCRELLAELKADGLV